MIILEVEGEKSMSINTDMLNNYKKESDMYLINVKRELTKQLVDYRCFKKLQTVNNSFYVILKNLHERYYTNSNLLIKDKEVLQKEIDLFLKSIKVEVSNEKFNNINNSLGKLILVVTKLIKIADSMLRNERN